MAKTLADYAKSMGVEVADLKDALKKYGMSEDELVNQQKRRVLANAIESKWSRDEYKAQYDMGVADSADWDWEQIVEKFKYSLGVLKEYKDDLKPIFKWLAGELQKGEKPENLTEEFNRRVGETAFGKRTSTEIAADLARYGSSKKDFKDQLAALTREVRNVAKSKFGTGMLDQLDEGVARKLAMDLIYQEGGFLNGEYDSAEIERRLRPLFNKDLNQKGDAGQIVGGEAGSYQTALLTWLGQNGVVMNKSRVDGYVKQMLDGTMDLAQIKQQIREKDFTRQYGAYADLFKQGQDVADIALDYRQTMAQLLEKPLESISIDDLMVKQAMQWQNSDGKAAAMPLYEFEKKVRQSPEWDKTDNAMRAYTDVGETILKQFGFRG